MTTKAKIRALEDRLEKQYNLRILWLYPIDNDLLKLSQIKVYAKDRGKGIGTKVMSEIIAYADRHGLTIALTPSPEKDTVREKNRLGRWYKKMGFVLNKGRNKDFRTRETMLRFPLQRNPKPIKTKLVPPSRVRLVGFCPKKTKIIEKHIPVALKAVQQVFKTRSKFPSPIYPMEPEEIAEGRSSVDKGHPLGAGHGMYFPMFQLVKINPNMEPIDILANVVHENIHHIDPTIEELTVRDLTVNIMEEVFGVPTDGRPYAK
jgi:predicted GNAT family acetyltransferase